MFKESHQSVSMNHSHTQWVPVTKTEHVVMLACTKYSIVRCYQLIKQSPQSVAFNDEQFIILLAKGKENTIRGLTFSEKCMLII